MARRKPFFSFLDDITSQDPKRLVAVTAKANMMLTFDAVVFSLLMKYTGWLPIKLPHLPEVIALFALTNLVAWYFSKYEKAVSGLFLLVEFSLLGVSTYFVYLTVSLTSPFLVLYSMTFATIGLIWVNLD